MRATKLLKKVKHLSYVEWLKYPNLPTLQYRRFRGDIIMVYKLLSGIYDSKIACQLVKPTNFVTRGHYLRLFKRHWLASCGWADQVQAGDVGLSLTTLHSPPLPVRSTNLCHWHSFSSASSFICHWRFTCPSDAACHCWWSGVSGCGCQTLEWTSRQRHRFPVSGSFPSSA